MAGRDLVKTEGKIDIELSQERGDTADNDQLGVPPQTEARKERDLTQNFDHIYSHVATDHERRRSKDSDQFNTLFDSQIELPDLNDLIDSPLVPEVPKDFTLTRSSSGVVFGGDGNTVQIEEDSIHSFDTEGDSRSLLLNDTLTEVSEMYASATTCPGSDNEIYASPDDEHIEPVYEEIPFLRNRNRDQPIARCSAASNEGSPQGDDNPVDCHLTTKPREPALIPDASAPADTGRVPECDVIYQKVSTSSSRSTSSSVESKPRDDTMAFFKRSFAKVRLDLLFRKKKNTKFVECVEKVIEARRSGCIDEDGNFVQTLDEQLAKHAKETTKDKKSKESGGDSGEKRSEDEVKPQEMGVSNPNYRESYPLPEEDDGSEGYASASEIETVDSSNSSNSGPERSPRLSGILSNRSSHHESSEDSGDVDGDGKGKRVSRRTSSRRVRFSDEVQEFEHIHLLGKEDRSFVLSSSDDDESVNDDDVCVLSLTSKISLFENMSKMKDPSKLHPKLTRTSGHRHSDPGPTRDSMIPDPTEFTDSNDGKCIKLGSITKARVQVFEKLSNMKPGERVPKPKPRTSLLEIRMNQTKQKIMFFEQLKSGQIMPLHEKDGE